MRPMGVVAASGVRVVLGVVLSIVLATSGSVPALAQPPQEILDDLSVTVWEPTADESGVSQPTDSVDSQLLLAGGTTVPGQIYGNAHWTVDGSPYLLNYNTRLMSGATLTIDPGVVIKGGHITIYGTLVAEGDAEDPIVFTSLKDDTVGGDTDGVVATPAGGDWGGIFFSGSSANSSSLSHVTVRYGGALNPIGGSGTSYRAGLLFASGAQPSGVSEIAVDQTAGYGVYVVGSSPAIRQSTLTDCGSAGIRVASGSPVIEDVVATGSPYGAYLDSASSPVLRRFDAAENDNYPIWMSAQSTPSLEDLSGDGNGTDGVFIGGTRTSTTPLSLPAAGLPYVGQFTIGAAAHVTIAPGVVMKCDWVQALGELTAEGTADAPILFTSLKDDTVGGDTDNVAATPAAGDWYGVQVSGTSSSATRIGQTEIRYAGLPGTVGSYSYSAGLTIANGATPAAVSDVVAKDCRGAGFQLHSSTQSLVGMTATNCDYGLKSTAQTSVSDSTFSHNLYAGVYASSGSMNLSNSLVELTTNKGVETASGVTGDIRNSVIRANGDGIYLTNSLTGVHHNQIYANNRGIFFWVYSGQQSAAEVRYNDIKDNTTANVEVTNLALADVRYNYWGSAEGPGPVDRLRTLFEPWGRFPYSTTSAADQVLGGNTRCGIWGEPINTATGNFYFEATDLELPGVGPAISLSRTYNNQDALRPGPLGYGWTMNADSAVQADEGGASVLYPGGARRSFEATTGGFISPEGTTEKLVAIAGGGFELRFLDESTYVYGASGALVEVRDKSGNSVTFVRDASGRLSRIEGSPQHRSHLPQRAHRQCDRFRHKNGHLQLQRLRRPHGRERAWCQGDAFRLRLSSPSPLRCLREAPG